MEEARAAPFAGCGRMRSSLDIEEAVIAREEFIAAVSREDDLYVLRGEFGNQERRNGRRIRDGSSK